MTGRGQGFNRNGGLPPRQQDREGTTREQPHQERTAVVRVPFLRGQWHKRFSISGSAAPGVPFAGRAATSTGGRSHMRTRNGTARTKNYVKNESYVHVVYSPVSRVDAKKRKTARRKSSFVYSSNANCNIARTRKKKDARHAVTYYRGIAFPIGRVDASRVEVVPSSDYFRPLKKTVTRRRGHNSGEVTI